MNNTTEWELIEENTQKSSISNPVMKNSDDFFLIDRHRANQLKKTIEDIREIAGNVFLNMTKNENYRELLEGDEEFIEKELQENSYKYVIDVALNEKRIYSSEALNEIRNILTKALKVRDYSMSDIQHLTGLNDESFRKLIG